MAPRTPQTDGLSQPEDRDPLQRSPGLAQRGPGLAEYAVEIRTPAEMEPELPAWRDLAKRAVEPNVFAEPELVMPAIQHLPEGRGVVLLLVWEGPRSTAAGGTLRAVLPLLMPRLTVLRQVRIWTPIPTASGVPLVDRKAPVQVIEAALAFLAARYARFTGLAVTEVAINGPFAAALRSAAARTRRALEPSEPRPRHILVNASFEGAADAVRRKLVEDLRDGRQALSSLGDVEMDHARTSRWVRDSVEELLVLDASGPAGRRGEALLQAPGMASFLRIATRQLAQRGRCRVDVLRVNGRAIAAAIIVESETHAWMWKLAADASLAHLSPDTHLVLDVTRTQLDRPGLARTEAGWDFVNPAMAGLWREAKAANYVVAVTPRLSPATLAGRIGEGLRRLRLAPGAPASRLPRPRT